MPLWVAMGRCSCSKVCKEEMKEGRNEGSQEASEDVKGCEECWGGKTKQNKVVRKTDRARRESRKERIKE